MSGVRTHLHTVITERGTLVMISLLVYYGVVHGWKSVQMRLWADRNLKEAGWDVPRLDLGAQ